MNYQYLLRQIYDNPESQKEETTIIENPYELDSRELKSINSSYDLSVLNTSIPAQEIVEMVHNALLMTGNSRGRKKAFEFFFTD